MKTAKELFDENCFECGFIHMYKVIDEEDFIKCLEEYAIQSIDLATEKVKVFEKLENLYDDNSEYPIINKDSIIEIKELIK